MRALAVLGPQGHPPLPELPTAAEQGVPGLLVGGWHGFVAPARTPPTVLDKLEASLRHATNQPEVQAVFTAGGTIGQCQDRATMARLIREDSARWRRG